MAQKYKVLIEVEDGAEVTIKSVGEQLATATDQLPDEAKNRNPTGSGTNSFGTPDVDIDWEF